MADDLFAPTSSAASFSEAEQLLNGLLQLVTDLKPVHVSLAGQAAAAQSVVQDLQRSLAYLHSRAGHAPKPLPWVTKSPQTGSLSTLEPGKDARAEQAGPCRPQEQARRPPQASSNAASRAATSTAHAAGTRSTLGRPKLSAPLGAAPRPAATAGVGARPPLTRTTSAPTSSVRAPSPPAPPTAPPHAPPPPPPPVQQHPSHKPTPHIPDPTTITTTHASPCTPTGQTTQRDPLAPLNLPRVVTTSDMSPYSLHQPHSHHQHQHDQQASYEQQAQQSQRQQGQQYRGDVGAGVGQGSVAQHGVSASVGTTHSTVGAGAASVSMGTSNASLGTGASIVSMGTGQAVPYDPAVPPQLPSAFMRARHEYYTAVQHCRSLLPPTPTHNPTHPHPPPHSDTPHTDTEASHGVSFTALLRQAGEEFNHVLTQACNAGQIHSIASQQAGVKNSEPDIPQLQQAAQVGMAAYVAACTWVLQALSDLAKGRLDTQALADLESVLRELAVLRSEYEQGVAALRAAQVEQARAGAGGVGGKGVGGEGLVGGMSADRVAVAARWRNRFLRAAVGSRDSVRQGRVPRSLPPSMPRPLGFWLPAHCWPHPAHTHTSPLHTAPWLSLLPNSMLQEALHILPASQDTGVLLAGNTHLPAASSQHSRAHGRGLLQAQQHMFQLWLEAAAGQHLRVRTMPEHAKALQGPVERASKDRSHIHRGSNSHSRAVSMAVGHSGGHIEESDEGDSACDRLAARLRLAHLLLAKSGWSRLCSVVEQVQG